MEFTCDPAKDRVQQLTEIQCDSYNRSRGKLHELDGYDCPLCLNRGDRAAARYDETFHTWNQVFIECACMEKRRQRRRLAKSGLADITERCTFERYRTDTPWRERIKQTAQRFVEDPQGRFFFIGGQSGAGKSHICTAMALHLIDTGHRVRYMLWRDEATRLKAVVNKAEEYTPAIEELKQAEVLYIDDLFKTGRTADGSPQRPTAADINLAFELINHRSMAPGRITILSSECTSDDLLNIDETIAGRIIENSRPQGYCLNIGPDQSKNFRLTGSANQWEGR